MSKSTLKSKGRSTPKASTQKSKTVAKKSEAKRPAKAAAAKPAVKASAKAAPKAAPSKPGARKPAPAAAPKKTAAPSKAAPKKPAAPKATPPKAAPKKVAAKPVAGKPVAGKPVAGKPVAKPAPKKAAPVAKKKPAPAAAPRATARPAGGRSAKARAATAKATAAPPPRVPPQRAPKLADAIKAFEAAVKVFQRGNFANARDSFEKIVERYPNQTELVARVQTYLSICTRRLEPQGKAPQSPDALYDLGIVELNRAHYDRAIDLFKRALKSQPHQSHILYSLAAAQVRSGLTDEGLKTLERAVESRDIHRSHARNDPDFAALRDDARFQEIVGYSS
jgi:hypothetical protein